MPFECIQQSVAHLENYGFASFKYAQIEDFASCSRTARLAVLSAQALILPLKTLQCELEAAQLT